jgi:outer membrane protein OmpA-like peptidoglycan-associated protein
MSNQVSRLKELLFDHESKALGELAHRIETVSRDGQRQHDELSRELQRLTDAERREREDIEHRLTTVFERTATNERLTASVADIIDAALVKAEVDRHEPLARAIAPLVVRTVRTEITNSQDVLVEALYPMTGRMVKAYVASAMKDLVADINRRLDSSPVMLRLRSLTTGHSVGELVLAESQRLDVEELFLIRRGTGELIDHWPTTARDGDSGRDQVISGILTAINDFASEAFKGDGSSLRKVDLEGSQVYLRASPEHLLAVRCAGTAPRAVEDVIDDEFLATIERHHGALGEPQGAAAGDGTGTGLLLGGLAKRLATRIEEKRQELLTPPFGLRPLPVLASLLLLALIGFGGWSIAETLSSNRVRAVAERVLESSTEVRGYPMTLNVEPWGRALTISGLAPSTNAHEDIITRLQQLLPATNIRDRLAVMPEGAPDVRPEIARVERDAALARAAAERIGVLRTVDRALRRMGEARSDLDQLRAVHPSTIGKAYSTVTARITVLRDLREGLAGQPVHGEVAAEQTRQLVEIAHDLANTGARVAELLGASAQPQVAMMAKPHSVAEAAETLAAETERLEATIIAVAQADAVNRKPQPKPEGPTARDRLLAWIRTHAIFFSNEIDYRQPAWASVLLDQLADLMRESRATIRIVGYTDEVGGAARNNPLSLRRANKVGDELVARGVASARLVVVGRAQQRDISNITGPQSPNRRVEFEPAFEGEETGPPDVGEAQ